MKQVLSKIFGGLNPAYYFRHLVFGIVLLAVFAGGKMHSSVGIGMGELMMMVTSTLLYPYSRFVYESVVGFILGRNLFVVDGIMMMVVKIMTMCMCWFMAIFIAPLGLGFLYWRNTRPTA